jgi:hypothetical protein
MASSATSQFPLFRVIDGVRESEGAIVARVEQRRAKLAEETGLTGLALAEKLADELTDEAALKSALIGGAAALPISIPFLGPWISLGIALASGALFQVATEVELVYAVAAAYRTGLPPERLREVSFWLVRLSNFDDLQSKALAMGLRVTVRKLVEKLVAVGLSRALAATATGMMAGMMVQPAAAATPWYIRATKLLGVPVLAVLGWKSTRAVGERAMAYFAEELAASGTLDGSRKTTMSL